MYAFLLIQITYNKHHCVDVWMHLEVKFLTYNIGTFPFLEEIVILFFKVVIVICTHPQQYKIALIYSSYLSTFDIIDIFVLDIFVLGILSGKQYLPDHGGVSF